MKSRRFNYPFIFPAPIPWWIEIHTQLPVCTYYFGPFDTEQEAKVSQLGYMEDLIRENAQIMSCQVKQLQPKALTILDSEQALSTSYE